MLIEKGNDCAKVHPLMGDMPKPNAYEEGGDEHPHLAFEVDHTIFQSELISCKYTWDWNFVVEVQQFNSSLESGVDFCLT